MSFTDRLRCDVCWVFRIVGLVTIMCLLYLVVLHPLDFTYRIRGKNITETNIFEDSIKVVKFNNTEQFEKTIQTNSTGSPGSIVYNNITEKSAFSNHSAIANTDQEQKYRYVQSFPLNQERKRSLDLLQKMGVIIPSETRIPEDTKIILWYVKLRPFPELPNLHPLRNCPELHCRITTNKYFFDQSSAVLFMLQLLNMHHVTPPAKLKDQIWVLHNDESPHSQWATDSSIINSEKWRSKFNWTMDYREESDIYTPFGKIFKRQKPPKKDYKAIVAAKTGTVVIIYSNCNTMSERPNYLKELQKYVKVDIYGGCGTHQCPRHKDRYCLEQLGKKYKFFLSFENAFCKDYISEKFFRYYNMDALMIVRGGGNYSLHVPGEAILNTADFKSIEELGSMINKLNDNDDAYIEMLRIKDRYEGTVEEWPIVSDGRIVYETYAQNGDSYCELCRRMWNPDKYRTSYPDIRPYFKKGLCWPPTDLKTSQR